MALAFPNLLEPVGNGTYPRPYEVEVPTSSRLSIVDFSRFLFFLVCALL